MTKRRSLNNPPMPKVNSAVLSPWDLSRGEVTGKTTFRKQILRKGVINYKGKKIPFDDPMMTELAHNFNKGAYDQVPFVFANDKNEHNEDPSRFHGELVSVELTPDGLDGIFNLTRSGVKVVKNNPRLGVSARIMAGVEHSDGRTFGKSIRHVLATMNPRMTGMKPWQAVDLSEDEEVEVVDLTAITYEGGSRMATKTKAKKAKVTRPANGVVTVTTSKGKSKIDLSALSDEEFQALLDLSVAEGVAEGDEDEDVLDVTADLSDEDEDDEDDSDEDEDDESDDDDEDDDEEEEEDDEDEDDDTDLAIPDSFKKNIKGGKAKVAGKGTKKGVVQDEGNPFAKGKGKRKKKSSAAEMASLSFAERMAKADWRRERRDLAREGVPPFMLDLATPIMESPDAVTIDLSEDDTLDVTTTMRKMLDGMKGVIEIKPEIGHSIDLSLVDDEGNSKRQDSTKDFLDAWTNEYGNA